MLRQRPLDWAGWMERRADREPEPKNRDKRIGVQRMTWGIGLLMDPQAHEEMINKYRLPYLISHYTVPTRMLTPEGRIADPELRAYIAAHYDKSVDAWTHRQFGKGKRRAA